MILRFSLSSSRRDTPPGVSASPPPIEGPASEAHCHCEEGAARRGNPFSFRSFQDRAMLCIAGETDCHVASLLAMTRKLLACPSVAGAFPGRPGRGVPTRGSKNVDIFHVFYYNNLRSQSRSPLRGAGCIRLRGRLVAPTREPDTDHAVVGKDADYKTIVALHRKTDQQCDTFFRKGVLLCQPKTICASAP